jgi:hypothetical protein
MYHPIHDTSHRPRPLCVPRTLSRIAAPDCGSRRHQAIVATLPYLTPDGRESLFVADWLLCWVFSFVFAANFRPVPDSTPAAAVFATFAVPTYR